LNIELDLDSFKRNQYVKYLGGSKVISIESYRSDRQTDRHKQPTDFSTWTAKSSIKMPRGWEKPALRADW